MRKKFFLALGIFGGVGFLLVLLHWVPVFSPIDRAIFFITRPVLSPMDRFRAIIAGRWKTFTHRTSLEHDYDLLRAENEKLKGEVARLRTREIEAGLLKEQDAFLERQSFDVQKVRVITRVREGDHVYFLVDQGAGSGISPGLPVLSPEGFLVGKIVKTNADRSFVEPLTDTESMVGGVIAGKDDVQGIIKGEHNLGVVMEMIPIDKPLSKNDLIITSGTELDMPRGLLIGTVEEVHSKKGELFQGAYVKPSADFDQLRFVSIVRIHS